MESRVAALLCVACCFCNWWAGHVLCTSDNFNNIFADHQYKYSDQMVDKLAMYDAYCRQDFCPNLNPRGTQPCEDAHGNAKCTYDKVVQMDEDDFTQSTMKSAWKLCMNEEGDSDTRMIGVEELSDTYEATFAKAISCGWNNNMKLQNVSLFLITDAITKLQTFCTIALGIELVDKTEEEAEVNDCMQTLWSNVDANPKPTDIMTLYGFKEDGSLTSSRMRDIAVSLALMDNIYDLKNVSASKMKSKMMRRSMKQLINCTIQQGINVPKVKPQDNPFNFNVVIRTTSAYVVPTPAHLPPPPPPQGQRLKREAKSWQQKTPKRGLLMKKNTKQKRSQTPVAKVGAVSTDLSKISPGIQNISLDGNDLVIGMLFHLPEKRAEKTSVEKRRIQDFSDYDYGDYDYDNNHVTYVAFSVDEYVKRKVAAIQCAYEQAVASVKDDDHSHDYNYGATQTPPPNNDNTRAGALPDSACELNVNSTAVALALLLVSLWQKHHSF